MTENFDIADAEKTTDAYIAEYAPTQSDSLRTWILLSKLLDSKGATEEEKTWILRLLIASEKAQFWSGYRAGSPTGDMLN